MTNHYNRYNFNIKKVVTFEDHDDYCNTHCLSIGCMMAEKWPDPLSNVYGF